MIPSYCKSTSACNIINIVVGSGQVSCRSVVTTNKSSKLEGQKLPQRLLPSRASEAVLYGSRSGNSEFTAVGALGYTFFVN